MKMKSLVIAAALLGGLLSTASAVTLVDTGLAAVVAGKNEAPVPVHVVNPTNLPRSHMGATVNLKFTVDEHGRAHDIRVVSDKDRAAAKSLVAAISQWKFTPARKNGVPVSAKVELPLQLVEASASFVAQAAPKANAAAPLNYEAPMPTRIVNPTNLPSSYKGATVQVKFTVDEVGQAHNIRVVSDRDRALAKSLVAAISQWEFTPARKNGVPVSSKVVLPLELAGS